MAISLLLPNIATAISNIVVTGVTVYDFSELKSTYISKENVLIPNVNEEGWITAGNNQTVVYPGFMQGENASMDISYAMNYRFLGTLIKDDDWSTFTVDYADVVNKMVAIINAILAVHAPYSGRADMRLGRFSIGAKQDPIGQRYNGADFELLITEMQN